MSILQVSKCHGIAEKVLCEYKKQFDSIDADKNGYIERSELAELFKRALGDSIDTDDMITTLLKYGGGKSTEEARIDFYEFVGIIVKLKPSEEEENEYLREFFTLLDVDQSGFVDLDELYHGMRMSGLELSKEDAMEMMREADTNSDGKLSFEEFVTMMQQKQ